LSTACSNVGNECYSLLRSGLIDRQFGNAQSKIEQVMAPKMKSSVHTATTEVLRAIGKKIRVRRLAKGLTLAAVAEKTGLSASMLSLVETGKASSSVGTLVAISSVLDLHIGDLLGKDEHENKIVTTLAEQTVLKGLQGVVHRIVTDDNAHGLEITYQEYGRGTSNSHDPITHNGFEYGLILDGTLEVTVDGVKHPLSAGDLISYRSTRPHRIVNRGKRVRAIWINLRT
jgi:transcriptional regulator with XRE-family HTH domain